MAGCVSTFAGAQTPTSGRAAGAAPAPVADTAAPAGEYRPWGFDLSGRDTAVRPGDNFYGYANATYVKNLVIPADRSSWGSFNTLAELSRARVQQILTEAGAHPVAQPRTIEEKLGAFYAAFMDEKGIEAKGAAPLKPGLDAIRAVQDRQHFARLMAQAQFGFQFSLFGLSIDPDAKDPTRYSVSLSQGGLGLPDRDYYLQPRFAEKKAAYQAYVAQMLDLAGWPDAAQAAPRIVAFETEIAKISWARDAMRDPDKTYNPMSVAALVKAAPQFDWRSWLDAAGVGSATGLVLTTPSAVFAEAKLAGGTDLGTLRAWLAFHLADDAANALPAQFVKAAFLFHGKTIGGQPELEARWKRAVGATSGAMGMAIGKVYVARFFPPDEKATMEDLVGKLKDAFHKRLEHNSWMSPATRAEALRKLDNQAIQIGYPNKWRDYDGLEVRPDDAFGNAERAVAFEWRYWLGHMGKPVDRDEWVMTPQTVNAYNNPPFDEVVFPAAILQPPFFNKDADPAINFGGIGAVIGHEMTHSFDDEGRKFDRLGRLHDWWTPADAKAFDARAAKLGAQYDTFSPIAGLHVNGKLTMGENIADLGGLTLALDAYHAWLGGKTAPVLDGLTGDQRVFLGWAQIWRTKLRPDAVKMRLTVDPHSPPEARVNYVMRNIDAWYKAWAVKPGDALYVAPKDRVQIW